MRTERHCTVGPAELTTGTRDVKQELDKRCEELMATKFGEKCDFDVEDALEKLEKLQIITKVSLSFRNLTFTSALVVTLFGNFMVIGIFCIQGDGAFGASIGEV